MLAVTLLAAVALAQWTRDPGGRSGRGGFGGGNRGGVPDWENDSELPMASLPLPVRNTPVMGGDLEVDGGWITPMQI